MYEYKAKIIRVVDADTVQAEVDLGFRLTATFRFRIMDYDAPETWRPRNELEQEHGAKATNRAIELLLNKTITLLTKKDPGVYGRWAAKIILDDGSDFATTMISEGFEKNASY